MEIRLDLLVSVIVFASILYHREVVAQKERGLLIDRIMAKDFQQFKLAQLRQEQPKIRQKAVVPVATDEDMAKWEQQRQDQLAQLNNEVDEQLLKLKTAKVHDKKASSVGGK